LESKGCKKGVSSFTINQKGKKIMKKIIALLSVLIVTLGASACNTMKGMGQDVERGGEKVQDAAQSTQKKM
jgi:entericidin B